MSKEDQNCSTFKIYFYMEQGHIIWVIVSNTILKSSTFTNISWLMDDLMAWVFDLGQ